MKANELRIGNWYQEYLPKTDKWIEAQFNLGDFCFLYNTDVSPDEAGYEPIPLTKEWLERFGFENMRKEVAGVYFDGNIWKKGVYWLNQVSGNAGDYQFGIGVTASDWQSTIIHFVHQLQNLYYALTSTELELTEKKEM